MGNKQHQYSVLQPQQPGVWKQFERADHCTIIKNQETGQLAEVYTVVMKDQKEMKTELDMYQYRKTNNTKLVSVISVEKSSSSGLCSGTETYQVVTQRIPLRLGQVDNLQLPESLYVLRESLDGFELIQGSIEGPILITKEMIGFNTQGKVKVWINENFSLNQPDPASYIKGESYQLDNSVMPLELVSLIEQQTTTKQFPREFKARIEQQQKNTLSFARMKAILRNFCIQNNISLEGKPSIVAEQVEIAEEQIPGDKIMIIQQTTIQRIPPGQPLRPANVSMVQSVPANIVQPVQPFQQVNQPTRGFQQIIQYQQRVAPIQSRPIVTQQQPITMRPPVVVNGSNSISAQPNYTIGMPYLPQQNSVYQPAMNHLHSESFTQPKMFQGRTEYSERLNFPSSSPVSVPVSNIGYSPSVQAYSPSPAKYSQYNYSNDYKLALNPQSDLSKKFSQIKAPEFNFSELKNPYSFSNLKDSTAHLGMATASSKKPTYQPLDFQSYSKLTSPLKNDTYLRSDSLSKKNSISSLNVTNSPYKAIGSSDLMSLKSYEYSTGTKNEKSDSLQERVDKQGFNYTRRPLIDDLKPRVTGSLTSDDLFLKIDQLSNEIKNQIEDVKYDYKNQVKSRGSMKV